MPKKSQELAAYWKTQVEQVEEEYKRWYERGKRISARYRDEREKIDDQKRHFNLFWSNTETLKPVIYSKTPIPIVERRFLDKDPTGRVAAQILERALRYEVAMSGFDSAIRRCRTDYLIPGRGQVWVRYNPQFGESVSIKQTSPDDMEIDGKPLEADKEEQGDRIEQEIIRETLEVDYIHWQDYYQFPAKVRTEQEIEGKGRRIFMTREDMEERWPKHGSKIPLDHVPGGLPDEGARAIVASKDLAQATIYEIWWKPTRSVYFIAKEYDELIEEVDDPLKLEEFFPCPEALHTTVTNDLMIPVPDYVESQDQYIQIDELTKRIDVLTGALKVRGTYDASQMAVRRLFEEGEEPQLYPVDSWAAFAEKGGIIGSISMVPLKDISDTLTKLIEVRAALIQDLDRTTGIWDIMRGVSDARETLGAQRLKTNQGATRIQERQDDVSRFCRDIINIMGEIISEHYDDQTLLMVSGAMFDEGLDPPPLPVPQAPPAMGPVGGQMQLPAPIGQQLPAQMGPMQQQPQTMQEPPALKQMRKMQLIQSALALLRQDKLRGFRIDIETDSTIQGDAQQEKESRIAFIEGVTQFIGQAAQIAAGVPDFAPPAARCFSSQSGVSRVGRDLESGNRGLYGQGGAGSQGQSGTEASQSRNDQGRSREDEGTG